MKALITITKNEEIMKKFKIRIGSKWQTIFAENSDVALNIAKVNLGYKETDVMISWTLEFFNGIEHLHNRCKEYVGKNKEVVEFWGKTEKEREYGYSIEILKNSGYYDVICFEWNDDELAEKVYKELEIYNREVTPLEKYQASF